MSVLVALRRLKLSELLWVARLLVLLVLLVSLVLLVRSLELGLHVAVRRRVHRGGHAHGGVLVLNRVAALRLHWVSA